MKARLFKRGGWWYCRGGNAWASGRTYADAYQKWWALVSCY